MSVPASSSIAPVLAKLATHGLEASFLVPTKTGLEKSIIDAVGPFRSFLKNKGFHDYEVQHQGVIRHERACLVEPTRLVDSTVSLYRPNTKSGDPRIWFRGLPHYANPGDLIAVVCDKSVLYVINASNPDVVESITKPDSPLARAFPAISRLSPAGAELLGMLKDVARKGFVRSLRTGDTGVGYTLETHLGLVANSAREPDYRGIEIKASRLSARKGQANRITLFSQVPDWNRSVLTSGAAILKSYGYVEQSRLQLYCTVSDSPNPQGLYLDVSEGDLVHNRAVHKDGLVHDVVCWESELLLERLRQKHPETMWVKARTKRSGEGEAFHFVQAVYTRDPLTENLLSLIGGGTVTMDYTLSMLPQGRARDHGYLFKIHPTDLAALFPPPLVIDLAS